MLSHHDGRTGIGLGMGVGTGPFTAILRPFDV